jgi:hypothetical protein
MTTSEARTVAAEAAEKLGIRGMLDVLIEYANNELEALTTTNDKLARVRMASDHRQLVNTAEKVHN